MSLDLVPNRRGFLVGAAAVALAAPMLSSRAGATSHAAGVRPVWTDRSGFALRGHDPVAYFTRGTHVAGSADHEADWAGARWRFASADARERFLAAPESYAPQYGGHCAFAMSRGYLASTVPEAWRIVDDKLYLNFSLGVRRRWVQDIPGNIARGDANWPDFVEA